MKWLVVIVLCLAVLPSKEIQDCYDRAGANKYIAGVDYVMECTIRLLDRWAQEGGPCGFVDGEEA